MALKSLKEMALPVTIKGMFVGMAIPKLAYLAESAAVKPLALITLPETVKPPILAMVSAKALVMAIG